MKLLHLYMRGARGLSFRASLFTYAVTIALLAPVGVAVAYGWGDHVASVVVIAGATILALAGCVLRLRG